MKFFAGFIIATLIVLIIVINAYLFFDLNIQTNNETENYNPPQEVQQQKYDDHIEEQQDDSQELTPSGLTVEEYNKLPHNNAGTNNQKYLKEME